MLIRIIIFLLLVATARSEEKKNLFPEDLKTEYEEYEEYTARDLLCSNLNASISFSGLYLNEIKKNFVSSPLITCLDLNDNSISSIDSNAFENLPNLKYLDLSSNSFDISTMLNDNFLKIETLILNFCAAPYNLVINGQYPELKKLFLKNTGLHRIQSDSKDNFPSLTHLYLSDNMIGDTDFRWLPGSLQYLDLSRNYLQSLRLSNLTNLVKLFVDNQYHRYLTTIEFQNLIRLKYLSMRWNSIGDISTSTFENITSLTYLDISNNLIRSIEGGTFDSMRNLQFLNLSNNNLETIQKGTFDQLQGLRILVLEKNLITAFPMVTHETKLKSLLLNCNKIKSIFGSTFSKMPFLESLYLHDNEITYIDQNAFIGLQNLKVLTLSNNHLSSLPLNWMVPLNSLIKLDLIGNSFKNFSDLALSESSGLQNLYLSQQLEYINAQALFAIPDNVTIDLRGDVTFVEQCAKDNMKYNPQYYG